MNTSRCEADVKERFGREFSDTFAEGLKWLELDEPLSPFSINIESLYHIESLKEEEYEGNYDIILTEKNNINYWCKEYFSNDFFASSRCISVAELIKQTADKFSQEVLALFNPPTQTPQ